MLPLPTLVSSTPPMEEAAFRRRARGIEVPVNPMHRPDHFPSSRQIDVVAVLLEDRNRSLHIFERRRRPLQHDPYGESGDNSSEPFVIKPFRSFNCLVEHGLYLLELCL